MRRIEFQNMVPVDGDRFSVTDDAIVDFCLRPDGQIDQEANAADEINDELCVENGSITKGLFKRLVEVSAWMLGLQPQQCVKRIRFAKDSAIFACCHHSEWRLSFGPFWEKNS